MGPIKALVVDDEGFIVEEISDFLVRRGFRVVTAESVEQAERNLKASGPFDVVVTDMRMAPGSGLDVIRACNRLEEPRPAVVLVTGQATEDQIAEARREGVNTVLAKPLSFRALLDALNELQGSRQQGP